MRHITVIIVVALFALAILVICQVFGCSRTTKAEKAAVAQVVSQLSASETQIVKMTFVKKSLTDRVELKSHVGGSPYIDDRYKYPYNDSVPLCFLAQINFADVPEIEDYPQKGLLQFFASCDVGKNIAYVRFIPMNAEMNVPAETQVQILGESASILSSSMYEIKFQLHTEFISYTNNDSPKLPEISGDNYRKVEKYTGISAVGDYSKLSGYPYFKGKDLRNAANKQLLAQFIVDNKIFQFYGKHQQLVSGDYSDVELIVQN
jgi:uncharacterized protein YwqG